MPKCCATAATIPDSNSLLPYSVKAPMPENIRGIGALIVMPASLPLNQSIWQCWLNVFKFVPNNGWITIIVCIFVVGIGFGSYPRLFGKNKALTIISRSQRKSLRNWFLFRRKSNRNAVRGDDLYSLLRRFARTLTLKLMFIPIRCGHIFLYVSGGFSFSGFPWTRKERCLHLFSFLRFLMLLVCRCFDSWMHIMTIKTNGCN